MKRDITLGHGSTKLRVRLPDYRGEIQGHYFI
jgi:hypothetical protein